MTTDLAHPDHGGAGQGDRRLVLIGAALGAFGVLFAVVRAEQSRATDLAITLRMQGRRSRPLGVLMQAVSWPGYPPQSRIIPPVVVGAWLASGRPRAARFQAAAWSGAALSTAIKAVVRRPRPLPPEVEVIVAPLGGSSFPSGHVLTYVTFYGFLAQLLSSHAGRALPRRLAVGGLTALIVLVGPSRIQQGHHWATDVIASYLLGLASLLALVGLYQRRAKERQSGGAAAAARPG